MATQSESGPPLVSWPPPAVDLPDYEDDSDAPRELWRVLRSLIWGFLAAVVVICIVSAVLVPLAAGAASEPVRPPVRACDKHAAIVQVLATRYSERKEAFGMQADGRVLELYVSDRGSWTVLVSQPSGWSCIVAGGTHWSSPHGALVGR